MLITSSSISHSLGLPASIPVSDVSYKVSAHLCSHGQDRQCLTMAQPSGESSSFPSIRNLYCWAFSLSANEGRHVRQHVADYEASLHSQRRADNSVPYLPIFFGFQLAAISSLKELQSLGSEMSNPSLQPLQMRCTSHARVQIPESPGSLDAAFLRPVWSIS